MEILNLQTNKVNQNGYNNNILTHSKVGILYTAPVNFVPDDCLACNGYVLKIEDYEKLYNKIGGNFNDGTEAEDEFRIPDYNISGRFFQPGIETGKKIEPGLPNITGWFQICGADSSFPYINASGSLYVSSTVYNSRRIQSVSAAKTTPVTGTSFDAAKSSDIYGNSVTVQPPSQIIHICIKYK